MKGTIPLALGEAAHDDVFVFGWHLLLDILLESPEQEGAQDRV
jgi:hypothetical protein